VRDHDFIAHEDLRIRNMSKALAPKPDPATPGSFLPNGAAAKPERTARSLMPDGECS
jgi:putative transposase